MVETETTRKKEPEITGRREEAEHLVKYTTETMGLSEAAAVASLIRATSMILDRLPDGPRALLVEASSMILRVRNVPDERSRS